MNEGRKPGIQPLYIVKVVGGLLALAGFAATSTLVRWQDLSPAIRLGGISALLLLAISIVPLVQTAYWRQDELHRTMHQMASTSALLWAAAISAAIGALQAAGLLATFSQFWTLGAIVCLWGLRLMLADRRYL